MVSLVMPATIGLLVWVPVRALNWVIVFIIIVVRVLMAVVIVSWASIIIAIVGDASTWEDISLVRMWVIKLPLAIVMIIMAIVIVDFWLRGMKRMLLVVLLGLESELASLARVLSKERVHVLRHILPCRWSDPLQILHDSLFKVKFFLGMAYTCERSCSESHCILHFKTT